MTWGWWMKQLPCKDWPPTKGREVTPGRIGEWLGGGEGLGGGAAGSSIIPSYLLRGCLVSRD
jgi:hypothetical protein